MFDFLDFAPLASAARNRTGRFWACTALAVAAPACSNEQPVPSRDAQLIRSAVAEAEMRGKAPAEGSEMLQPKAEAENLQEETESGRS